MKNRAVVKSGAREFFEILDRVRCRVGPELHDHFAFARFDYRYFVGF